MEADPVAVQRRTLRVVVASQVLGGAGLAAGITVGGLLAAQLLGGAVYAGLPVAALTLGSAVSAFLIGRGVQRYGRRPALAAGFTTGAVGAAGVVVAGATGSAALLFAALVVYGAGSATNLQARYAGTDLAPAERRATAVSIALVSTTAGAVAGPNLVTATGALAAAWGLPALVGPFLLAGAAYLAAAAVLTALLRPDPFLLARSLRAATPVRDAAPPGGLRRGVLVGATVLVIAQVAMTAIMTMTPVHLAQHHHDLRAVGLVIGLHVAAMYLPSLGTGLLVDRIGRTRMAVAAGVVLLTAGVAAAVLGDSVAASATALVLLGLGWNIGLITGTAMVVDATTPEERGRVQGSVDVLVALSGAGGGAISGVVAAAAGYSALAIGCGVLAVLLVPVVLLRRAAA
ncbi:MFS transporter [Amnibacterium endophyticum]|uniref:MFS transporter n=1 Tax=Amnibacterium endophyticum TaxID=2109337 RepID=A0ABW4LG73_9MICO